MMFPIFIENSRIPVWLSKIAPIDINAITLGPVVLSRGTLPPDIKNHEAIHWAQYKECLIFPFLILYGLSWLINRFSMSGSEAYRKIWFEQEAYDNQHDLDYLSKRKFFAWARK